MYTEIIFDIETQKLFDEIKSGNPADLGVSIVSLYKRTLDEKYQETDGQIYSFFEKDLPSMWPLFGNVDRVIGFNSLHFDNPILASRAPFDFKKLNHLDILSEIEKVVGHRISLNAVARETLGRQKTDVGTNAVLYFLENTPESLAKLQHYCEADVLVTKDVYDYALCRGHLKYKDRWNTPRTVPLDFSYPPSSSSPQASLF